MAQTRVEIKYGAGVYYDHDPTFGCDRLLKSDIACASRINKVVFRNEREYSIYLDWTRRQRVVPACQAGMMTIMDHGRQQLTQRILAGIFPTL